MAILRPKQAAEPPLRNGVRLTRAEFEARHRRMSAVKKAELKGSIRPLSFVLKPRASLTVSLKAGRRLTVRRLCPVTTPYVFRHHDPTRLNRQGNDVGTQYRRGTYHNGAQTRVAQRSLADPQASGLWPGDIVTELLDFGEAKAYQTYSNPDQRCCTFGPKVETLRKEKALA